MTTDPTKRIEELQERHQRCDADNPIGLSLIGFDAIALASELAEKLAEWEEAPEGDLSIPHKLELADAAYLSQLQRSEQLDHDLGKEQQAHAETKRELAVAIEALKNIASGTTVQCLTARLGEGTIECGVGDKTCAACRAARSTETTKRELEREQAAHLATAKHHNDYASRLEAEIERERKRREVVEQFAESVGNLLANEWEARVIATGVVARFENWSMRRGQLEGHQEPDVAHEAVPSPKPHPPRDGEGDDGEERKDHE